MKHLYVFLTFIFCVGLTGMAQERFTVRLQTASAGKGRVVLHQSAEISNLVDGASASSAHRTSVGPDSIDVQSYHGVDSVLNHYSSLSATGQRVRMNGFRIQVYAGGNNRESKLRAQQMENRVSNYYPELNTYTRFVSPRWICHLGDFTSREQAMVVLEDLRSKGGFNEAIIVKSKVNAWVPKFE